jgi:hypothetical protein
MTRVQILEDQKAIFTAQKEELENKRGDIYVREQQAMSDTLTPFFSDFTPEVEIEVQRGSVYFKMAHPEYSYKKELFNIYLRENWNYVDGKEKRKSFNGVDLSYYTTQTKGDNAWELKRLRLLGKLAEVVEDNSFSILYAVNNVVIPFKEEYDRIYDQMNLINQAIRDLDIKIFSFKKEKIEFNLKNGGVEFKETGYIDLKYNYTPRVKSIKLIDFSPSGKKATAIFTWAHGGQEGREEGVNVGKVIDQVVGYSNIIV